ncbi:hypothetical protein, partial [Pseudomonas aeruginosa]|uniref:hypothetical protein n=1 Tax=Pseudomonas aeruginosa TaxID=287 RepID=UPI002237E92D
AGTDLLGATLQRLVNRSGEPIALIVDFASRLAVRNDALSAAEPAEQRRGQGPARRLVGLRHRDMAQARVVHQQPVGQVAFL